jgi:murein DD-endopeptidase MepM/ murein hydrolase activator NlpD
VREVFLARRLEVVITGDAKSLERTFSRASQSSNNLGRSLTTLGKTAALGIAGAFAGAAAATKVFVDEALEAQRVTAQTNAVIKSTGGIAGVSAGEVDKLAAALMRKSGVDDEAIKSGQNMLLTFTNVRNVVGEGNDVFDQATQATLDLSVAMGKDMTDAAILVGKALQDPLKGMTALGRAGIQFTADQKETIKTLVESNRVMDAQKIILGELETQFGGSAAAAGKTFSGQMNIARESIKNAGGEIVQGLLPHIARLATVVADDVMPAMSEWGDELEDRIGPAVREVADAVQRNWPEIKETAGDVADKLADVAEVGWDIAEMADGVADRMGGWDDAFEVILTGLLATKLTGVAGKIRGIGAAATAALTGAGAGAAGGAAAGGVGGLLRSLRALSKLSATGLVITLAFDYKNSGKSFRDWFFGENGFDIGDILPVGIGGRPQGRGNTQGTGIIQQPGGSPVERMTGRGSTQGSGGIQLGTFHSAGASHETKGLAGYPAIDIMAKAGTPVRAPEDGMITRVRPFNSTDRGLWGAAIYFLGRATGNSYYIKHIVNPAPDGSYKRGDVIAYVAAGTRNGDHVHFGIKKGAGSVANPQPSTQTPTGPTGAGGGGGAAPPTNGGARGSSGPKVDPNDLPGTLREQLAIAAGTSGVKDDLRALAQVEAFLEGRIAKTKDPGKRADLRERLNDVRKEIKGINDELRETEKKREALRLERIAEASRKAVENARKALEAMRGRLGDAFDGLASKALQAFDRITQNTIGQRRAASAELTPEERALAAFDAARTAEERQRLRDEANAIEDADERKRRLRELDLADERALLQSRAEESRKARDQEFDTWLEGYEEQRQLERDHFERSLAALQKRFEDGKISAAGYLEGLRGLFGEFEVPFTNAGDALGKALAAGLTVSLGEVQRLAGEYEAALGRGVL